MSGAARLVSCPNCGGSIRIAAVGYTVNVACQYCGSELDAAGPDIQLITAYHEAVAPLELALGSQGLVKGVEWRVVGYQERSDDEMSWGEYLLFNPYAGYRWLIRSDGEWSFGTPLTALPTERGGNAVSFGGESFVCDYDPVTTTTDKIVGEFYWRARRGDQVEAATFDGGATSLSYERSADEVNWTLIETLPNDGSLERNFQPGGAPAGSPRAPQGFGRRQSRSAFSSATPSVEPVRGDDLGTMIALGFGTVALLFLLTLFLGGGGRSAAQTISLQPGVPAQSFTLARLTITRPFQMVTVTARGDQFVNKWVDLDYSLVDVRTQQAIDAYGLMEYYSGSDSDGRWTEGSHVTRTKFAGIPRGTYDVVVDASASQWSDPRAFYASSDGSDGSSTTPDPIAITFIVAPGGVFFSNFWLFAILALLPLGLTIYSRTKRGYL